MHVDWQSIRVAEEAKLTHNTTILNKASRLKPLGPVDSFAAGCLSKIGVRDCMKIRMWCDIHECPVITAETKNLHWLPIELADSTNPDETHVTLFNHWTLEEETFPAEFELDEGDLYCPMTNNQDNPEHTFRFTVRDSLSVVVD